MHTCVQGMDVDHGLTDPPFFAAAGAGTITVITLGANINTCQPANNFSETESI